jgi:hypothetical protein
MLNSPADTKPGRLSLHTLPSSKGCIVEIKTIELTRTALDWAVAKADGKAPKIDCTSFRDAFIYRVYLGWSYAYHSSGSIVEYKPSTDWAEGGPIIEREGISVRHVLDRFWCADIQNGDCECDGHTPLIAAMRCFVMSKLGYTVDIPELLIPNYNQQD